MHKKTRADLYLVEQKLAEHVEMARSLIMAGVVYIGDVRISTPGEHIAAGSQVEIRTRKQRYVSRGGLKLEKALAAFALDLNGVLAMDVGASTGGFTDCMLQNGARRVYSVDVGYGQLAWKLRTDDRVVNLERTNIRKLDASILEDKLDFASIDVSFISLSAVLPVVRQLMRRNGKIVALIKPQFEAPREFVGEKGVVRDSGVHVTVISNVIRFCQQHDFFVCGLTYSPIRGPEGNIEYLIYLTCQKAESKVSEQDICHIVAEAHEKQLPRH